MSHSSKSDWWHTLSSILSIFDPCWLGVWSDRIFPIGTSSNMGQHPYVWTLTLLILCFPRVLESKALLWTPLASSYISSGEISCLEDSASLRMSYLLQIGIQPSSLHLLRCSHGRWGFFWASLRPPWHVCTTSMFSQRETSQKGLDGWIYMRNLRDQCCDFSVFCLLCKLFQQICSKPVHLMPNRPNGGQDLLAV